METLEVSKNNEVKISALEDLQTLLRRSIDEELSLLDYSISSLLSVGENYASMMFKVDAVIRRTKNSPKETLHLVAKTIPTIEYMKDRINTAVIFNKELFVYEKLAPAYEQIEKSSINNEKELLNIFPKFYGGKVTRDANFSGIADEKTVLLMENMKIQGYYNLDKKKGLDLHYSKLAISKLAHFHALGIAVKQHKPELFREAEELFNSAYPFKTIESEYINLTESTLNLVCQDPRIAKYEDILRPLILPMLEWKNFFGGEIIEPWTTIIHGDFWVNNIMFHQNYDCTETDNVKFVDYQLTRICNPLTDLPYFLTVSVSPEVLTNHMDELLHVYLDRFVEVLERTGCDASHFTWTNFEEQLKRLARKQLFYCLMAVKFMTIEVASDEVANELLSKGIMADGNKLFFERTWAVISKYVDKGWL